MQGFPARWLGGGSFVKPHFTLVPNPSPGPPRRQVSDRQNLGRRAVRSVMQWQGLIGGLAGPPLVFVDCRDGDVWNILQLSAVKAGDKSSSEGMSEFSFSVYKLNVE